jgi:Ca-activated chloride channel family protein
MTFVHPAVLQALWLLPVLLLLRLWASAKSQHAAQLFIAPSLRGELVRTSSALLSWSRFAFQLLALCSLIIAVAGPRYGEEEIPVKEQGRSVLIAIDTSRSMNAVDIKPSRLERAKLAAEDLMISLANERVGLIAVAGSAYMQAPLTNDHDALVENIQALDSYTVPAGGSKLSAGVKEALQMCSKTAAREHCLIFFSDGGETDPELDTSLRQAREKNIRIITIGIGTKEGSLIPNLDAGSTNEYVIDPETQRAVHSTLNEGLLQQMASATNGRYFNLGESGASRGFIAQVLSTMGSIETGAKEVTVPIERFAWPLSLGIIALIIALLLRSHLFIRPSRVGVALLLLGLAQPAWAKTNYNLEAARKAYELNDFSHAVEIYNYLLDHESAPRELINYGLGSALYKLGKQDRAIEALSKALQSDEPEMQKNAHHTLGNSLYEAGDSVLKSQPAQTHKAWTDAISHYDAALKIKDDLQIQENRKELLKRIKQLDEQKPQDNPQKNESKQDSNKSDSNKEKQESSKAPSTPEEDQKNQQDQQGESGEEEQNSEKSDKSQDKQGQKDSPKSKEDPASPDNQGEPEPKGDGDQQNTNDSKKDGSEDNAGEMREPTTNDALPEGAIQTTEHQQDQNADTQANPVEQRDEKTGFGKEEARNLLRMYSEQITQKQLNQQQNQRRRMRPASKDW